MEQLKKISIVTIFPEMFKVLSEYGVIKKSIEKNIINIETVFLRDYTHDKHHITDRAPYGGGPGQVMIPEPFFEFYNDYLKTNEKPYVVMTSPQGKVFNQEVAKNLSKKNNLVFLCGRYEGIDERVMNIVDDEISVGDYVLTGGEIPTMLMIDALLRFVPGVVGNKNSVIDDSFFNGLLDFPHYTRPSEVVGLEVPEVLKSGNHKKINDYNKKQSFLKTILKRPDLFLNRELNFEDKKIIVEIIGELYQNAK